MQINQVSELVLLIAILHYIGDFILQTEKMAVNKSTSNYYLGIHGITYGLPFLPFFGIEFYLWAIVGHTIVDYFTSRATSYYHKVGNTRRFFQVIGFDQLLHITMLIITLELVYIKG